MLRFAALLLAMAPVAVEPTVTIPLNGHNFTLPAGFTIELAAGPPLVDRPVTVAFDEIGRLYVADSSGSNEKLTIQLEKKPHRIVRLDPAVDGVFKTGHVYADKMMFPEGTMWYRGSLYVAGPPSIWKLTDTTGNGIADQRSEWYQGKTLGGCGNDLHGPWLGPDGWFYWTKGGFQPQKHVFAGKEIETRASILFRAKPDGSQREPIMVGGMDNPVGLAFTPGGEPILTNTFLVYPSNGQRDGLIHAVYGGVYGKDFADVLAPHIRTSTKLMPVLEHLGPAAPTGIVRYDSDVFGPEYRDNMFVGQFNLRKVSRHILTPKGATFESKTSDFLVSDSPDFHPTDVVMDADGSLLIVDTGGWYKLCCPTSQLVKPDVLGAIYRVRKVGAKAPEDPRGLRIDWKNSSSAELAKLFGDPRPAVRIRVREMLGDRGQEAVSALKSHLQKGSASLAKREALWTLMRIEDPNPNGARGLILSALTDADADVRQVALYGICRSGDRSAESRLREITRNGTPQNRRSAAEALGRIHRKDPEPSFDTWTYGDPPLEPAATFLKALGETTDPFLCHALIYAMIESRDSTSLLMAARSKSPVVQRGALMANEQIPSIWKVGGAPVLAALNASDHEVRTTAWWIASRHPSWAAEIAHAVDDRLRASLSAEDRADLLQQLAAVSRTPAIQEFLARQVRAKDAPLPVRRMFLAAMSQAALKDVPASWVAAVNEALSTPDLAADAVVSVRALRLPKTVPDELLQTLDRLGNDASQSTPVRLGALAARPTQSRGLSVEAFVFVRERMETSPSHVERGFAVDALARSKLSAEQLIAIADAIPKANPLEVDRLLELFAGQKDAAVGARLMDALEQPKLAGSLRVDSLERRLKNFGLAVQARAAKLYARLNADLAGQRSHLEELLTKLPAGDVRLGQAVFNRAKSACTACHTIGYVGGKTGPDLTRVGSIRTRRDLLEAVVFPSASFVRGYEPIVVVTTDGKTHNGLIRAENADEITLTTGPNQEDRIARKDIESMQPSRVSVMPAGLEQQMSAIDLADLVAFLGACK